MRRRNASTGKQLYAKDGSVSNSAGNFIKFHIKINGI